MLPWATNGGSATSALNAGRNLLRQANCANETGLAALRAASSTRTFPLILMANEDVITGIATAVPPPGRPFGAITLQGMRRRPRGPRSHNPPCARCTELSSASPSRVSPNPRWVPGAFWPAPER